MGHHSHCICVITPTLLMMSQPLYVWHHTWCMYGSICIIHDMTLTLYDFKPQYLWYHVHYLSHQIYCIQHHIRYTCDITARVSKTSNWLYVWNQTNMCVISYALYDITPTLFDIRAMYHTLREIHICWERETDTKRETHTERDTNTHWMGWNHWENDKL